MPRTRKFFLEFWKGCRALYKKLLVKPFQVEAGNTWARLAALLLMGCYLILFSLGLGDDSGWTVGLNCLTFWLAVALVLRGGIKLLVRVYKLPLKAAGLYMMAGSGIGNMPAIEIENGKVKKRDTDSAGSLLEMSRDIRIDSYSAVVLERFGRFSRVLGVGNHTLAHFERVYCAFDLRPRLKQREVHATTKDGIPVKSLVSVEFRMTPIVFEPPKAKPSLLWLAFQALYEAGALLLAPLGGDLRSRFLARMDQMWEPAPPESHPPTFSANPQLLRRAAYAPKVARGQNGEGLLGQWHDIPLGIAGGAWRTVLNETTFDRLFEPEDVDGATYLEPDRTAVAIANTQLREVIGKRLLSALGCDLVQLTVTEVQLDQEKLDEVRPSLASQVKAQMERTWSAEWRRRTQSADGQSAAEAQRLQEMVRAQSQARLLGSILQSLPKDGDPQAVRKLVVLRLLQALEQMRLKDGAVQFYPSQFVQALESLNRIVTSS